MVSEHKVSYISDNINNNSYVENNTMKTSVNIELNENSEQNNITLLNYDDYIEVNGYKVYGHPFKWILDYEQQYQNCGVESTMNILSIAHKLVCRLGFNPTT